MILLPGSVLAQSPTDDEVNAVAENLNCPTCQSLNLSDCSTQTCAQWKEQIRDLLAEGYSKEEVLDWYVVRYGEQVLQEPRRSGIGLYAWLLPILGFLVGIVWLAIILKKWSAKKQVSTAAPAVPELDGDSADDYLRRVEQDLKEL